MKMSNGRMMKVVDAMTKMSRFMWVLKIFGWSLKSCVSFLITSLATYPAGSIHGVLSIMTSTLLLRSTRSIIV